MSNENYKHIGDPIDCLVEECGEVIQAAMKIKRFGVGRNDKETTASTNAENLLGELTDVEDRIKEVREFLKNAISNS